MKQTAGNMGVDLLLVDTGDLHDGNGLSDATKVDGTESMPIFNEIDYDILTIGMYPIWNFSTSRESANLTLGNHELYVTEVAYQMFNDYAGKWGDKYITSNVKILNPKTNKFEYVGATHRYFTTPKGVRIMAFGVLYDFTGMCNSGRASY